MADAKQPELQLEQVPQAAVFSGEKKSFDQAARMADTLSKTSLVPEAYRGKPENCLVALEMANRIGTSPLMVMQNLHVIQGKPSWGSSFIIGILNSCKRFSELRWRFSGEGEDYGCEAYATDLNTGEVLTGPKISWRMVKAEGWYGKAGSKWVNMPELMFRYRASAFFGRLYAPDILMGMLTLEEVQDIQRAPASDVKDQLDKASEQMQKATSLKELEIIDESFPELVSSKEYQKARAYYQRINKLK